MLNQMNIHHTNVYRKRLFSALLITAISIPLAVTAGIYKWTDEDGNVHYGSQRPANVTSERMKIQSGRPSQADEAPAKDETGKKTSEENKEEKKPETTAPKANEPPKLSRKEKKSRCQQANKSVQTIVTRGRVRVRQEDGTTRHMTDQERSKRLAQARKNVAKYCK